jgi:hypothetical protein
VYNSGHQQGIPITNYAASRWNRVSAAIAQANTRLQLAGHFADLWVASVCYEMVTGMAILAAIHASSQSSQRRGDRYLYGQHL